MFDDEAVAQIRAHGINQFGEKTLTAHALKLSEECGEVAGAVIRHSERRDGRGWLSELEHEVGDVLVTVAQVCAASGISMEQVARDSKERFLNRTWDIQHKPE